MIIEARELAIGYRDRVIGRDLGLALAEGQVLALLGPNGGGKTTLLRTLLGLIRPLGGEVLLGGRALDEVSVRDRARAMAYVPQVSGGTFGFTVEDIVLMGRTAHGGAFARPSTHDERLSCAALERLGIAALAKRPYTRISGGERQLALIARALAQEPRLVVLDEPTASLDFGNQGRVLREIRALAASGLAVLFTTHDPNQALRYADHVLLIRDGRILDQGPSGATLTRGGLEALYEAPVDEVRSDLGRAFLPG